MISSTTGPASQPAPENQRMEHDGHIDPEPIIPSTKDIGIQVQVTHIVSLMTMAHPMVQYHISTKVNSSIPYKLYTQNLHCT